MSHTPRATAGRYRICMNTLALRLAVGDGRVDGIPVRALVSAGFTLLPRCAPLVLALGTRRAGILLPPGAALVTAIAACDGRGAVWFEPSPPTAHPGIVEITTDAIARFDIAAIFTIAPLADRVPPGTPVVLLDEVPTRATLRTATGPDRPIDLGSHFGLTVEGSTDEPGRDEECLVLADTGATLSHHEVLVGDARLPSALRGLLAPLLRGAHLATVIAP